MTAHFHVSLPFKSMEKITKRDITERTYDCISRKYDVQNIYLKEYFTIRRQIAYITHLKKLQGLQTLKNSLKNDM